MADYVTMMVATFSGSDEELTWLEEFLPLINPDGFVDANAPLLLEKLKREAEVLVALDAWRPINEAVINEDRGPSFERQEHHIRFTNEEGGMCPDALASLVHLCMRKFKKTGWWGAEWAQVCSKLREGDIGGGAVVVSANEIKWLSTREWLEEHT